MIDSGVAPSWNARMTSSSRTRELPTRRRPRHLDEAEAIQVVPQRSCVHLVFSFNHMSIAKQARFHGVMTVPMGFSKCLSAERLR